MKSFGISIAEVGRLVESGLILEAQTLLEGSGLKVSDAIQINLCRNDELGDKLLAVQSVLRNSLFAPDPSPDATLMSIIGKYFYSAPKAMNYIVYNLGRIVGTAQVDISLDTARLHGIGFLPKSPEFPYSIRGQGYYSLMDCLRMIYCASEACRYVSALSSNPIVALKFDLWRFYYCPLLLAELHPDKDRFSTTTAAQLETKAIDFWKRITRHPVSKTLIVRRSHIATGRFRVTRTPSHNPTINRFIEENLEMGDRMIFIKEFDESALQIVRDNLRSWIAHS